FTWELARLTILFKMVFPELTLSQFSIRMQRQHHEQSIQVSLLILIRRSSMHLLASLLMSAPERLEAQLCCKDSIRDNTAMFRERLTSLFTVKVNCSLV